MQQYQNHIIQIIIILCLLIVSSLIYAADKKYYLKDHLGSTRVVIDEIGMIAETYDYYPYGLQMPGKIMTSGTTTKNLYTGKEHDEETGWDYFGARYYSSAIGRWMTVDPLSGDYPGFSAYNYVQNNPLAFIDPDGKKVRFAPGSNIKFKESFAKAVEHLNKHGAAGMLAELETRPEIIYIEQASGPHFDSRTMTIYWSPSEGGKTGRGIILSPTSILNHEVDHALDYVKDPVQHKKNVKTDDPDYGNKEEKRVITGSEQTTALKLGEIEEGEVTRTNHEGEIVKTTGPTSNVERSNPNHIKNEQQKSSKSKEEEN